VSINGYPDAIFGNVLQGAVIPARSIIYGERAIAAAGDPTSASVHFKQVLPAQIETGDVAIQKYLDGTYQGTERGGSPVSIMGVRPDVSHDIDLLALTPQENAGGLVASIFSHDSRGSRVKLTWAALRDSGSAGVGGVNSYQDTSKAWVVDQWKRGRLTTGGISYWVTSNTTDTLTISGDLTGVSAEWSLDIPDFKSYKIYYDEGDGLGADTLVEGGEIFGVDSTEFISGPLADDTYEFAIQYTDFTGNESALAIASITKEVDSPPQALTSVALAYNQTTRKVTLTWAQPGGQDADVVGVAVYDNCLLGMIDLADAPLVTPKFRRSFVALGTETWTSFELWDGVWRFAACAVDAMGHHSNYTEKKITLAYSGGNLVQVTNPPDVAPDFLEARPVAGGAIQLTAQWYGAAAVSLRIYQDDSLAKTFGVADSGTAGVGGNTTYTDATKAWIINEWATRTLTIGAATYTVISNTATVLTVAENLTGAGATYSLASGVNSYQWTTGALTDGQEYEFYAVAVNSGGEGPPSNSLTATADSTAPSGDQILVAEIVE